ncbi:hypothetical protein MRX96_055782 [Rhipicephalus microplus]
MIRKGLKTNYLIKEDPQPKLDGYGFCEKAFPVWKVSIADGKIRSKFLKKIVAPAQKRIKSIDPDAAIRKESCNSQVDPVVQACLNMKHYESAFCVDVKLVDHYENDSHGGTDRTLGTGHLSHLSNPAACTVSASHSSHVL